MNLKKVYAFHAKELGNIIVHFSEDGKSPVHWDF